MHTIYYMEDDGDISASVTEYLSRRGFLVRCFSTAAGMRQALLKFRPDLLILDWNMPDGAGDELCGWARERWPGLPIILLTVRDSTQEVVAGFRNGADDYVTKPFSLAVLRARVNNLLRRGAVPRGEVVELPPFSFDFAGMAFSRNGEAIELSKTEQRLLRLLVEHRGQTLTREQLLDRVWDGGEFVDENALSVAVRRLRAKLGDAPIKTVYGLGYTWEIQ